MSISAPSRKKTALICFGNEENYGLLFVGGELLLFNQDIKYFDAENDTVVEDAIMWQPDFIFFSPLTRFFPPALAVLRGIKNMLPSVISAFGGHHACAMPDIIDICEIDVVVVGPVRGSIEKILSGEKGVIRTLLTNPDDMPMPARKEYYRDIPRMANRYRKFMLSMLGCPWNCAYCSSSSDHLKDMYGKDAHKRYFLARRPMQVIIEEAKQILSLGNTEEIEWVDDDIFSGVDIETWLPEFVDIWEKEIGRPLYVSSTSTLSLKVSDNALATLKRIVNCIGIGVQAIRPESLKLLNRGWDNEEKMKMAYDRLTSFGYAVNLQAIVGLPVIDPVEDALETVKGLQRIGPGSICSVYPLQVYPGTMLEKHCKDNQLALNDLSNGDTNSGIPSIVFPDSATKKLRNICKLGTFFVKYNIDELWMRILINVDFSDETSQAISMGKYYECVVDRLGDKGKDIFADIQRGMKLVF
ncbi:MAG: radical SAM protein [Desulfuromonadaceae bacterium]|nr:radical SAM protein [Desulfuromonadaceae bacterium]MDD5106902.1 radical SAM protein [Desulfuromonadaceae bacterium]